MASGIGSRTMLKALGLKSKMAMATGQLEDDADKTTKGGHEAVDKLKSCLVSFSTHPDRSYAIRCDQKCKYCYRTNLVVKNCATRPTCFQLRQGTNPSYHVVLVR
jgi:hypothetical protein